MTKYFILVLLLAAVWTTRLLVQGSVRVQELVAPSCRIMGVALVNKKVEPQLNFTEAQKACKLLGLTLASKAQVEAALLSGFETCSYGWVAEQYPVIPRINQNPRCGKNGKGILIWKAKAHQKFRAYCHNSSDIWVNSCIPEIITTVDPLLDFETETHTAEFTVSDGTRSASALYSATPAPATTPAPAATSSSRRKKLICITEVFTETSSMPTEIEPTVEHGGTFKNEAAGFGGVPIALLVLALLFFGAAAGLAVCYVKRYVKAFPFTNKNQQKEMIETKVVKEEKADDGNPDEEPKKTDKNPEEPKSPPKTTVRCLEAEV